MYLQIVTIVPIYLQIVTYNYLLSIRIKHGIISQLDNDKTVIEIPISYAIGKSTVRDTKKKVRNCES